MFRDFAKEDASDTVIIDINSDVSMREGGSDNKRLEDDIYNFLLTKNFPSIFFFPPRKITGHC